MILIRYLLKIGNNRSNAKLLYSHIRCLFEAKTKILMIGVSNVSLVDKDVLPYQLKEQ